MHEPIFLITKGDYSDYHVCAVASTKELADKAFDLYKADDIIEYELDDFASIPPGHKPYRIMLDFDGNVIHFNEDDMLWFKEIDMPRASFISNKDCFAFHPLATSLDHAIKIATERRQELLRNNEWTCDPVEWNKIQQKKKTITSFLPQ